MEDYQKKVIVHISCKLLSVCTCIIEALLKFILNSLSERLRGHLVKIEVFIRTESLLDATV